MRFRRRLVLLIASALLVLPGEDEDEANLVRSCVAYQFVRFGNASSGFLAIKSQAASHIWTHRFTEYGDLLFSFLEEGKPKARSSHHYFSSYDT